MAMEMICNKQLPLLLGVLIVLHNSATVFSFSSSPWSSKAAPAATSLSIFSGSHATESYFSTPFCPPNNCHSYERDPGKSYLPGDGNSGHGIYYHANHSESKLDRSSDRGRRADSSNDNRMLDRQSSYERQLNYGNSRQPQGSMADASNYLRNDKKLPKKRRDDRPSDDSRDDVESSKTINRSMKNPMEPGRRFDCVRQTDSIGRFDNVRSRPRKNDQSIDNNGGGYSRADSQYSQENIARSKEAAARQRRFGNTQRVDNRAPPINRSSGQSNGGYNSPSNDELSQRVLRAMAPDMNSQYNNDFDHTMDGYHPFDHATNQHDPRINASDLETRLDSLKQDFASNKNPYNRHANEDDERTSDEDYDMRDLDVGILKSPNPYKRNGNDGNPLMQGAESRDISAGRNLEMDMKSPNPYKRNDSDDEQSSKNTESTEESHVKRLEARMIEMESRIDAFLTKV